jgi:tRNA pseudouridine55 synthase
MRNDDNIKLGFESSHQKRQNVNGILLLDKAIGLTSNSALTKVKRLFGAKKAGHTGSLDPLACGMLPICFGEATPFSQFLLEANKQYCVEAKLGVRTSTGDAEGEIIKSSPVYVDKTSLLKTLASFRGEIDQIPSMFSAIKYQGRPLYSYARQGIEIEREIRKVFIKELKLIKLTKDEFSVQITCSKGTYIRTLIDDIGEKLGCGAYVTFLRRTVVEPYLNHKMFTLEELGELKQQQQLETALLSIDSALLNLPIVNLNSTLAYYLSQGQPVIVPHAPTSGHVRLFSENSSFLGVGKILSDGRVAPRRLIAR